MITGKTSTGFEFCVNENVMDDIEVVDAIAEIGSDDIYENAAGFSTLCKKLLGKEKKKLYDHVRTEDGRVPSAALEKELLEIFKAFGKQGKN